MTILQQLDVSCASPSYEYPCSLHFFSLLYALIASTFFFAAPFLLLLPSEGFVSCCISYLFILVKIEFTKQR